jgi:hypothetical protein
LYRERGVVSRERCCIEREVLYRERGVVSRELKPIV